MAEKYIRTEYADGSVVLSNIRNKRGIPFFTENDTYTATKVLMWWDGSIMDDSKVDGKVYLKSRETGEYFKVNLPNDGQNFLEKDTMEQMRSLSSTEILLLRMGYYKGVRLSGYYTKGDTPAPINYVLSNTANPDDGGGVIEVSGIKLEHDFNYWVDLRYYGVKGNNTDETVQIQRAVNRAIGGTVYGAKPFSNYLTGQILFPSDTNMQLDPNVKWKAVDTLVQTSSSFEGLFRFVDANNCIIQANDSVFEMNKSAYSSEHNHIFIIDSCDNISIYNAVANNSGGDGFYITGLNGSSIIVPKGSRNHSSNIHLVKCRADNNRRNGLSIVGGYNITADDCVFTGSSGTSIQSGIDIEPEFRTDRSTKIYFNRCKFNDNAGRGSLINLQKFTNNQDPEIEIIYTDCIASTNGQHGFGTQLSQGIKGRIKYIRCISQENFYCGYLEISSTPELVKEYHDCLAINNNTSNSTNPIYSYGASWYIHYSETLDVPKVGGTKLYRCKSIDTRSSSTIRRAIGLRHADAKPEILPENIYIEDFTSLGHSIEEITMVSGCKNVSRRQTSEPKVVSIPDSANIQGIRPNLIGYEITNQGSTATIRVQLPVANEGYTFKFTVKSAQSFTIIPQTGKFINGLMRSSSSVVTSNIIGNTITIRGLEDGNWEVVNIFGSWSSYQTWSTVLRPTSPKTGESGYNSTLQLFEYYNGTSWVQLASTANATTTTRGLVNQSAVVANSSSAIPATDSNSTATDVAGVVTDLNDLISKYNSLRTVVNELQTQLNAKLTADRASGQQAT